jgi:hypothetical protein
MNKSIAWLNGRLPVFTNETPLPMELHPGKAKELLLSC